MEVAESTEKSVSRPTNSYTEFSKLGWMAKKQIPLIGSEVNVKINGIGISVVKKYFVEHGFIGLVVKPHNPPSWYIKQNGADAICHVFPAECEEFEVRHEDGSIDSEFYNATLCAFDEQEVQA